MAPAEQEITKQSVKYIIHYRYPYCIDDGGEGHDLLWDNSSEIIDAESDFDTALVSIDERFNQRESCNHGRYSSVTKIEKVMREKCANGFERTIKSELAIPRSRQCPCGKVYWPICGERACHILQPPHRLVQYGD